MLELITLALGTIGKVMDKFPNYPQEKKEKFHKLKDKLLHEKIKEPFDRDDNVIVQLELEVKQFIDDFQTFLSK